MWCYNNTGLVLIIIHSLQVLAGSGGLALVYLVCFGKWPDQVFFLRMLLGNICGDLPCCQFRHFLGHLWQERILAISVETSQGVKLLCSGHFLGHLLQLLMLVLGSELQERSFGLFHWNKNLRRLKASVSGCLFQTLSVQVVSDWKCILACFTGGQCPVFLDLFFPLLYLLMGMLFCLACFTRGLPACLFGNILSGALLSYWKCFFGMYHRMSAWWLFWKLTWL